MKAESETTNEPKPQSPPAAGEASAAPKPEITTATVIPLRTHLTLAQVARTRAAWKKL